MGVITVRNLDAEVQRRLKRRAAANNRSMEAEARAILSASVSEGDFIEAWLEATAHYRGDPLPVPKLSLPRDLDLA